MEAIDADFRHICQRLGVAAELTCINRGNHRLHTDYYTDDLRERVAAVYADDIAIFGYQFESRQHALSPLNHPVEAHTALRLTAFQNRVEG
jgi:hypothetical protein